MPPSSRLRRCKKPVFISTDAMWRVGKRRVDFYARRAPSMARTERVRLSMETVWPR